MQFRLPGGVRGRESPAAQTEQHDARAGEQSEQRVPAEARADCAVITRSTQPPSARPGPRAAGAAGERERGLY
eukprot:3578093-Rhodomonas_salina.1